MVVLNRLAKGALFLSLKNSSALHNGIMSAKRISVLNVFLGLILCGIRDGCF